MKNILMALLALWIGSAHAAEENCTFTSFLMQPGFLFYDTGTYVGGSKKTTSYSIVECQKKDSPLYAQFVAVVPSGLGAGTQASGRIGGRFACGSLDCDVSAALYNYKVDRRDVQETVDLRVTVSKTVPDILGGTVTPYVWLEEQKPMQVPRDHYFGGRIGMSYSRDVALLPSVPTLTVGISQWHYFSAPTSGKSIIMGDAFLGFRPRVGLSHFTVGPYYRRTQGSIETSDGGVTRSMFGVLVTFKF